VSLLALYLAGVRRIFSALPATTRHIMAFKYSCFISYCHGQHELIKAFMDQLRAALKAELELLLAEEIYIDDERLKPGYHYNEELAAAICQSVCMLVVYSPRYERQDYCVREYEAMERLQKKRFELLGSGVAGRGFIIPIVLRGADDIPPRIKSQTHYADFSRFTLASADLIRNPEYIGEIQKIAKVIYEHYLLFEETSIDPCVACGSFALPAIDELIPWRAARATWPPAFINR
jgi:hypothetical protein